MKIGLIGHSHIVCLMDALGEWRSQLGLRSGAKRSGFSASFDGWDATDTGNNLISFPTRKIGGVAADIRCAAVSGRHAYYDLVNLSGIEQGGSLMVSPTLLDYCRALGDCDALVSIVFGNQLAAHVWLNDKPSYDFVENSLPGPLLSGAQPVSRRYIDGINREYGKRAFFICMAIRQYVPRAKILHLLPPPPLESPSQIKFQEGLAEAMAEHGVLDARLRLKWYRAYAGSMMAQLGELGVTVLMPPPETCDANGFLRRELAEGLTHGNAQYGAMMWESVAVHLGAH